MIFVSFNKNTTAATNRAEIVYTSRAPKFTPDFFIVDRVVQTLVFCVALCRSLGVFFFHLAIVFSDILPSISSDYPLVPPSVTSITCFKQKVPEITLTIIKTV